jgi:hypothetical protein
MPANPYRRIVLGNQVGCSDNSRKLPGIKTPIHPTSGKGNSLSGRWLLSWAAVANALALR